MDDKDKILIKLQYKAKKEAINQLLKKHKENEEIVKKLREMQEELPVNI